METKLTFMPYKNTEVTGETWDDVFGMFVYMTEMGYSRKDIVKVINRYYNHADKTSENLNKKVHVYEKKYNGKFSKPTLYSGTKIETKDDYEKIIADFENYCVKFDKLNSEPEAQESSITTKEKAKNVHDIDDSEWDCGESESLYVEIDDIHVDNTEFIDTYKQKNAEKTEIGLDEISSLIKNDFDRLKKEESTDNSIDYKDLYEKMVSENIKLREIVKNMATLL